MEEEKVSKVDLLLERCGWLLFWVVIGVISNFITCCVIVDKLKR
jgi:hypothetical protein